MARYIITTTARPLSKTTFSSYMVYVNAKSPKQAKLDFMKNTDFKEKEVSVERVK